MKAQCVIVRTTSEVGGTEGLSSIIVQRGTPGITYGQLDKKDHRLASQLGDHLRQSPGCRRPSCSWEPPGNVDFVINGNFAWSG